MKLIGKFNDNIVLGKDGMSLNPPRITVRAILMNENGLYALIYSKKWNLYSFPGGGVEEGEDLVCALRREIDEETGCTCDEISELGIVEDNSASIDYAHTNYYYFVKTANSRGEVHLTDDEKLNGTSLGWYTYEEIVKLITDQKFDRTLAKYFHLRDLAALREYEKQQIKG